MSSDTSMAVIGVGHFGRFHAEKISRLSGTRLVAVADTDAERAREIGHLYDVSPIIDYRELFGRVDAVVVAVPTRKHYRIARDFLEHGVDVLVEKPITADVGTAEQLIQIAREKNCILQVGHLERFSGVVEAIRKHSKRPLYIDSVRISPFKARSTDINVILDVMIHDLDLILCLLNAPIISVDAAGSPVFSNSEDIASARIKFSDGCIANIVASRISLKSERKMRIFEYDRFLTTDLEKRTIRVVSRPAGNNPPSSIPAMELLDESYSAGDPLEKEIAAFAAAVRNRSEPVVSGEDGKTALEAAARVNDSLQSHADFLRQVEANLSGLSAAR